MANFVSPGVYVIEKDISDYTPAINPTVVGVVGFASKGPINKATLITSQQGLVQKFGRPQDSLAGQGLEGALEILETANNMYYVRAADADSASDASAVLTLGSCPAIGVSSNSYGIDNSLYLKVMVKNNDGTEMFVTPKTYAIAAGTQIGGRNATTQEEAMKAVIGGSLDSDKFGAYFTSGTTSVESSCGTYLVGNYAGSGAEITVSAYSDSAYTLGASGALLPLNLSGQVSGIADKYTNYLSGVSAITVKGISFDDASSTGEGLGYVVESLYPGQGYNLSTLADGSVQGNSMTVSSLGNHNVTVNVNSDGTTFESFKVSLVGSGAYVEDVINTGGTDLTSEVIQGNLYGDNAIFADTALTLYQDKIVDLGFDGPRGTGGAQTFYLPVGGHGHGPVSSISNDASTGLMNPRFNKFVQKTVNLVGGANGDGGGNTTSEAAALIGVAAPSATGIYALDKDLVPITMAIIPGITDQNVQNALITLAETTGNFLCVFGAPIGIGDPGDAIDYSNGVSPYRTAPFNSSYACLYYPAVKVFNPYLGKDLYMDPAIFAVRQMGFTDTVADLWFAPAGFVRGRLTKPTDTEVDLNQGDRDSLYSGGNIINPIADFPQQGITIFGQRTTQRSATALDRINVRRLMIYIKRVITASTQRFVFEPNDKITQERITTLLVPLFEDIKRRRGITEFKVVCDETVNTPERVDRNELWCKILIKPTKAAEILVFELNVTSQSTNIS